MSLFRRRLWPYLLAGTGLVLSVSALSVYRAFRNFRPEALLASPFVQNEIKRRVGEDHAPLFALMPDLLGFGQPRTFLVLFLNNTELRPGGGFIGVYAVVRADRGRTSVLKIEGTENIDNAAAKDKLPEPLPVMKDHLKVDRWYFRDANWSPDFAASARQALDLYRREGGTAAAEIDTVVGVTATVLEELMRLTGPVSVQGVGFAAGTVIEKLEYEVEYGYQEDGIHLTKRKQIIEPLMHAVLARSGEQVIGRSKEYVGVLDRLARERHLMLYSEDETFAGKLRDLDLSGAVKPAAGDYLLWADANLAALKTDHAIERGLNYELLPLPGGGYEARASMTYRHTGKFDWRTSRYRTYARVFVPPGAELVGAAGAMKWDRTVGEGPVDTGEELSKRWFGAFIAIEPGQTKTLTFRYKLPQPTADQIAQGSYNLSVQKQLGTIAPGLTLDLDFGRIVTGAAPAEEPGKWHDARYQIASDLREDREFSIRF